jgi:hypothetical protein
LFLNVLEKKNLMLSARTWSRIFILFSLWKVRIAWQDDHQARGREGLMRERERERAWHHETD